MKYFPLCRLRDQAGLSESHNLDLTFSVLFNLASQYDYNEMYTEALNTYAVSRSRYLLIRISHLQFPQVSLRHPQPTLFDSTLIEQHAS